MQLLTQLQLLSATANAMSSHLTTATATACHIKPTTASATANDGFQPGTTASTTAADKSTTTVTPCAIGDFRPGTTASTTANDGFRQPQLQLRSQLHTPASQLHTIRLPAIANFGQFCYI